MSEMGAVPPYSGDHWSRSGSKRGAHEEARCRELERQGGSIGLQQQLEHSTQCHYTYHELVQRSASPRLFLQLGLSYTHANYAPFHRFASTRNFLNILRLRFRRFHYYRPSHLHHSSLLGTGNEGERLAAVHAESGAA